MLTIRNIIQDSTIPMAGKGIFAGQNINKKKIIAFPNETHNLFSKQELQNLPEDSIENVSSIRWFEETFSCDISWSEESHFNHSFEPNCLWHLGFIFALRDIEEGEELTLNYEWLLDFDSKLDFLDSKTGREIRGLEFDEKMRRTTAILQNLFSESLC